jgi:hypothetical protein
MNVLRPEKRDEVLRLVADGLTDRDIHDRTGVSKNVIGKLRTSSGQPPRGNGMTWQSVIAKLAARRDELIAKLREYPEAVEAEKMDLAIQVLKEYGEPGLYAAERLATPRTEIPTEGRERKLHKARAEPAPAVPKRRGRPPKLKPQWPDRLPTGLLDVDAPKVTTKEPASVTEKPRRSHADIKPPAIKHAASPNGAGPTPASPTLKGLCVLLSRNGAMDMAAIQAKMGRLSLSDATTLLHEGIDKKMILRRPGAANDGSDKFYYGGTADFIGGAA